MPIRVSIVDPHEIMRVGIRHICDLRDDLEFVGESDSIDQARETIAASTPDVVVIDPESGAHDGSEVVRELHADLPSQRILVFSSNENGDNAHRLTAAGASGYVTKAASLDEIAAAIRAIHLGRMFISHTHQPVSRPIASPGRQQSPAGVLQHSMPPLDHSQAGVHAGETDETVTLSNREREVLMLLAEGMTNKQAAERLFLSIKTVETYRSRIMRKFGLRDRVELVRFARGVVRPIAS